MINRFPTRHDVLQVGDTVVVNGEQDDVMRLVQTEQMDLLEMADSDDPLTSGEVAMLEAVVVPGASFLHQTVVQADFRTRFGVSVLGIWRRGYALHTRLTEVPLEQGDVLLLRGPSERLAALAATEGLLPLGTVEPADTSLRRTLTAAGIMAGVVLLAALGVLHIAVSGLLGVIAMVVTGCVQPGAALSLGRVAGDLPDCGHAPAGYRNGDDRHGDVCRGSAGGMDRLLGAARGARGALLRSDPAHAGHVQCRCDRAPRPR